MSGPALRRRIRFLCKRRYDLLKSRGRCVSCGEKADRGARCPPCRIKNTRFRGSSGSTYIRRAAMGGVCPECGDPKQPDRWARCAECRDRNAANQRKRRNRPCDKCGLHGRHECVTAQAFGVGRGPGRTYPGTG